MIPSGSQLSHPLAYFSFDTSVNSPTRRTVERPVGQLGGISYGISVEYKYVSMYQNGHLDI
jgi:hypothetical protein